MIQDGANISSSTVATGNAGSVTINAGEFVEVSGTVPGSSLFSFVGSSAPILSESLRQAFGLPDKPSGNSGNLTINTPRLGVNNGANVSVSNDGTGGAGTLQVNANSIIVDRHGSVTAATASGEGGNLDLNIRDFLLLRNNSQITTSVSGNGNGGNIKINTGSIAAVPTENSDISANSANARGGNVTINASGIFGIQSRPQATPLSDITATGANSALSGIVQLNVNQLDPTSALAELSTTVVDPSRLIAQGCPATQGNTFVVSGRGGLPPTPEQQLDDDANWQDRRRLTVAQQPDHKRSDRSVDASQSKSSPPIVEATGWQTSPSGAVILVAPLPTSMVQNPLNQPIACQGRQ